MKPQVWCLRLFLKLVCFFVQVFHQEHQDKVKKENDGKTHKPIECCMEKRTYDDDDEKKNKPGDVFLLVPPSGHRTPPFSIL